MKSSLVFCNEKVNAFLAIQIQSRPPSLATIEFVGGYVFG